MTTMQPQSEASAAAYIINLDYCLSRPPPDTVAGLPGIIHKTRGLLSRIVDNNFFYIATFSSAQPEEGATSGPVFRPCFSTATVSGASVSYVSVDGGGLLPCHSQKSHLSASRAMGAVVAREGTERGAWGTVEEEVSPPTVADELH